VCRTVPPNALSAARRCGCRCRIAWCRTDTTAFLIGDIARGNGLQCHDDMGRSKVGINRFHGGQRQ